MAKYTLAPAAQSDLIEIRRYTLRAWGELQWRNYYDELKNSMALLADNELIGIEVTELGQGYYRFPLKHHVIYYIQREENIVVVGVLGKSMSPAKHFQALL
ncbi:type II toxin-antitoxin system RelE/ParE family toxin [Vibrio alfacsensis]|uniref:type II toxin-antitoxin system RelE/ParE family toxin n=1 Tax=Vibrio alfacsensis TaxID=1074311 RepID=UPI001BEF2C33|nr:type II toxin-antitoxin system RelE/ParE family toxin [Vibrio alfacsensis]BCN27401.1 plasmid stabilization protein [Vibrio alfacsensis]